MPKQVITVRLARWSAYHPWRSILCWLALIAFCVVLGSLVGTNSATGADYRVGEAGRAESIEAGAGVLEPVEEDVLITAADGVPFDPAAGRAAADDVVRRMRALPGVEQVAAPVAAQNGAAFLVPVTLKAAGPETQPDVQPLLDATAAAQAAHREVRIAQTGSVSIDAGIDVQLAKDLQLAERITLPATLLILVVVFGALVAAAVPVVLALSSVVMAISLSSLASWVFPDAGATKNVILLMGMAVGVDYSLFYLKREREERARSGGKLSPAAAVELAARTSGHTVMVSAVAVAVSMTGLYLANDVVFSSLATGSVIVVLVAMISALTVLPAMLVKFNRRLDRPRLPLLGRRASGAAPSRMWSVLLRPAVKYPMLTLALSTVAMLALAAPALGMKLALPGNASLPQGVEALQTFDRMTAEYPEVGIHHTVVVRADASRSVEVSAALTALARAAAADPLFVSAQPAPVVVSADRTVSRIDLPIAFSSDSPEAARSLRTVREHLLPAALSTVPGTENAVTGFVARDVDTVDHQTQRLPWVVGFVIVLSFVIMLWAFRSVVIAAMAVALNLLSAAAAFGVLVITFQGGWAQGILGFTAGHFIVSRVPLFLFVILFGLSMDYHVFVVSRIRELALAGVPARRAVFEGITSSASVVTGAAMVMVSVFVSFVFTGLLEMKQLGFGLAVAVILDAFVIRILILPALMTLLGARSWWPSRPVVSTPEPLVVAPPNVLVGRSSAATGG